MPKPQADDLRRYLKLKPGDGRAWLLLAQELADQPPGEEFEHAVNKSLEFLPDNFQAWQLAGKAVAKLQGEAAALDWLGAAAKEHGDLLAPRLALGSLLQRLQPERGIKELEQLVRDHHSDNRPGILLAGAYARLERFEDAAKCIRALLVRHPGSARHWGMLAEYQLRNGQYNEALESAERSLKLDDQLSVSWEIKAEASRLLGDPRAALAAYLAIEKIQSLSAEHLVRIGNFHVRLEQFAEAERYYRKALANSPGYFNAQLNLGLLSAAKGDIPAAIDALESLLRDTQLDPGLRADTEVTLTCLHEHQRLEPLITGAAQTHRIGELKAELKRGPGALQKPDPRCEANLRRVAEQCREAGVLAELPAALPDSKYFPFLEAWSQCKLPLDAGRMATTYLQTQGQTPAAAGIDVGRDLVAIWHSNRDRRGRHVNAVEEGDWEAWLRYWHARLMSDKRNRGRGQFKLLKNTVGAQGFMHTADVANVVGTFRVIYEQLRPMIPAGPQRGIFMMVAVLLIHGFSDGNGRLARFVLGWECELAGYFGVMIPQSIYDEYLRSMSLIDLKGDCSAILGLPASSYGVVSALLPEFEEALDRQG